MRPYGQRMGANDFDGRDEPVPVVVKKHARAEAKRQAHEAPEEDAGLTYRIRP